MNTDIINLDDLLKPSESTALKQEYLSTIMRLCHEHIRNAHEHGNQGCIFVPPRFMFGYPIYNYNEVVSYVYSKLQENGLYVRPHSNSGINISWHPQDINYGAYQAYKDSNRPINVLGGDKLTIVETPRPRMSDKSSTNSVKHMAILETRKGVKDMFPVNLS